MIAFCSGSLFFISHFLDGAFDKINKRNRGISMKDPRIGVE